MMDVSHPFPVLLLAIHDIYVACKYSFMGFQFSHSQLEFLIEFCHGVQSIIYASHAYNRQYQCSRNGSLKGKWVCAVWNVS